MSKLPHIVLLFTIFLPLAQAATLDQAAVDQFIFEMNDKHHFDVNALKKIFAKTRHSKRVMQAITRTAERKPWHQYRKIFLGEERLKQGVRFWTTHVENLRRSERAYDVDPQIIVAIIGVETYYGKHKGRDRVMDALATLAFHYPRRAQFFRAELEQFLLLSREQNVDPLSIMGSYAGAMGIPQFISSSYRHYAVDFDGDGKKDLWQNPVDAIGSVANYFNQHGWTLDGRVAFAVESANETIKSVANTNPKPTFKAGDVGRIDHPSAHGLSEDALISVMEFAQPDGKDYWIGFDNFYVITRYNHSRLYAMAVFQLSELIKTEYDKTLNVEAQP